MEIYFIRHAQGEHSIDVPKSLEKVHPGLTPLGRQQAAVLRDRIALKSSDLLIASPTIRTLETSVILARDSRTPIYVSPLIGPRMFPVDVHEGTTLLCDYILSAKSVKRKFPHAVVIYEHYKGLTNEGLNNENHERYGEAVIRLMEWIRLQRAERVFIVSHDGTIIEYRQRLTGKTLTESDSLEDAEYIKLYYE